MYTLTIYFNGPNSRWSGSVRPEETLAVQEVPWLWLARWLARTRVQGFIPGRVGWAINCSKGSLLERFDPSEATA